MWSTTNLQRRHGELAGAEEDDDGGGHRERDEWGDEVARRRRGVVRMQRLVVVTRCGKRGSIRTNQKGYKIFLAYTRMAPTHWKRNVRTSF